MLVALMENNWINTRVMEALKVAPVADGVVNVVRDSLHGTMRERALRGTEVAELAETLLAAARSRPAEGAA